MAGTGGVETGAIKDVLIFLGTAGIVVPVFRRLKVSPVLGFLGAGVVLGPQLLGRLDGLWPALRYVTLGSVDEAAHVGELGVVFLMFMIGLELSWPRLRAMRMLVFGLGGAQVGACALGIAAIAMAFGQPALASLLLGVALALSSTAIIVPILAEAGRLGTQTGRATFAVLLFQDLAVAPVLVLIAILGSRADTSLGLGLALALAPAIVGLATIILIGRLVLRPLFHHVAAARSTELFMAACLLVVLGTGLAAQAAGLSMALGAFVAGLLLSETEFRREIEVTIEPFQGLLLGLFFMAVGAGLDLSLLVSRPGTVLGLCLGLIAVKTGIMFGLTRLPVFGLRAETGREVALLTAPGGEFAFVILGAALAAGLVAGPVAAPAVLAATLTMIAIPGLARLGEWLNARSARKGQRAQAEMPAAEPGRVIIVGYGRVGHLIGQMLTAHKLPFLAVDGDAGLVARERRAGVAAVYGDATRAEFLDRCGLETARAVVVTMDVPDAVERIVTLARAKRPDVTIVARARDAQHARKLYGLGVTDAVPETIEASLQLSEALLVDVGVPMGLVIASIHEKRDEFRRLLAVPEGLHEGRSRRAVRQASRKSDKREGEDAA